VTLGISIDIECFPELKEEGFLDVEKTTTFGRAMGDLIYNREADLYITNTSQIRRSLKVVPPDQIVFDFFMWDSELHKFRQMEPYQKILDLAKEKGIDKCVMMDFSLWYNQPEPSIFNNLYMNFVRVRQAQDQGFKAMLNWNNIMTKYFPVYERCLPSKIPGIVMDLNHGDLDKKFIKEDVEALKLFLEIIEVNQFVIQTARKKVNFLSPFLSVLISHDVTFSFIPSQTRILSLVLSRQRKDKKDRGTPS
jgi:hypothetical protein